MDFFESCTGSNPRRSFIQMHLLIGRMLHVHTSFNGSVSTYTSADIIQYSWSRQMTITECWRACISSVIMCYSSNAMYATGATSETTRRHTRPYTSSTYPLEGTPITLKWAKYKHFPSRAKHFLLCSINSYILCNYPSFGMLCVPSGSRNGSHNFICFLRSGNPRAGKQHVQGRIYMEEFPSNNSRKNEYCYILLRSYLFIIIYKHLFIITW